jgi:hypothetical protein
LLAAKEMRVIVRVEYEKSLGPSVMEADRENVLEPAQEPLVSYFVDPRSLDRYRLSFGSLAFE